MDRAKLLQELEQIERMRRTYEADSPEGMALLADAEVIRHQLQLEPPDPAAGGTSAAVGGGGTSAVGGYLDDTKNPSRGGGIYQQDLSRVDFEERLSTRGEVPAEYLKSMNVARSRASAPVPPATIPPSEEPGPPTVSRPAPPPPPPGAQRRKRLRIPRPNLGNVPRLGLHFESPQQAVGWGLTALTLAWYGFKAYRDWRNG